MCPVVPKEKDGCKLCSDCLGSYLGTMIRDGLIGTMLPTFVGMLNPSRWSKGHPRSSRECREFLDGPRPRKESGSAAVLSERPVHDDVATLRKSVCSGTWQLPVCALPCRFAGTRRPPLHGLPSDRAGSCPPLIRLCRARRARVRSFQRWHISRRNCPTDALPCSFVTVSSTKCRGTSGNASGATSGTWRRVPRRAHLVPMGVSRQWKVSA